MWADARCVQVNMGAGSLEKWKENPDIAYHLSVSQLEFESESHLLDSNDIYAHCML